MDRLSDDEIMVILEATEPMELLRRPTEGDVWFKNIGVNERHGWEEVEIRGNFYDVYDFITLHWDEETARGILYRRDNE